MGKKLCVTAMLSLFFLLSCAQQRSQIVSNTSDSVGPVSSATVTSEKIWSDTVEMGPSGFAQARIYIHAGQIVHFINDRPGALHILCFGENGRCIQTRGGPQELQPPGLHIQQGETRDIRFKQPGIYTIICLIHAMKLTLSVT